MENNSRICIIGVKNTKVNLILLNIPFLYLTLGRFKNLSIINGKED